MRLGLAPWNHLNKEGSIISENQKFDKRNFGKTKMASFQGDAMRRAMMCICTSENLEIPGLLLARHPGMTLTGSFRWRLAVPVPGMARKLAP